jgi:putative ABC transport system ATP-binding protein
VLEIQELSKRYASRAVQGSPSFMALDGVSLSLARGEFVAIVGPSGSGKSTLLMAAGGLLAPTEGNVIFEGQNIYGLSPEARSRWRAQQIGFVFQQFHLIPYLSVLDNVLAPGLAGSMQDARRRALELLERFGLTARASHLPAELSAGEQQRTAMARALLKRPPLLLCDEPTGNLDAQSAEEVLRCLIEFHRDGGAVLLVTHHVGAAAAAQRKLLLVSGEFIFDGSW